MAVKYFQIIMKSVLLSQQNLENKSKHFQRTHNLEIVNTDSQFANKIKYITRKVVDQFIKSSLENMDVNLGFLA